MRRLLPIAAALALLAGPAAAVNPDEQLADPKLEARALKPGAQITILARSESLDSLTLEGPLGRATLGLRPAALVKVLPGEADPGLFHVVPTTVIAGIS